MYKLKIMNYQNYEYELLQEVLDKMASQGYETNGIHWLTLFKKTNKKYNYAVDLFQVEGKSHFDKSASEERFIDPYLDKDYELIFKHHGMYVFKGQQEKPRIQWNKKPNFVTNKKTTKANLAFAGMFALTTFFIMNTLTQTTIDTFKSYGMIFIYIGLLLLCLSLTYYFGLKTYYLSQLKKHIHEKGYSKKSILKKHHFLYTVLFIFSIISIIGGVIEDRFNYQNVSINKHPVIQLKDLDIHQDTQMTYTKNTGFITSEYCQYLEYTNDEKYILQVKEYTFQSDMKAQSTWNDFFNNPALYHCDSNKKDNHIIHGYLNNQLTNLIFLKNNHVYNISISFSLTEKQLQTIINYYQ